MSTAGTPWSVVSASVRGASHERTGLPNQDATASRDLPEPLAGVVAAVADGHGGSRYVRSDRGSAFAVGIACEATAEFLAGHPDRTGTDLARRAAAQLVPAIVDGWRSRVRADLVDDPLTDEERERTGDAGDSDPYLLYGATLLIAAASDPAVLLLQIGDGDILAVPASGDVRRPVPDDDRLVAGETTSLGLADAAESFRVVALSPTSDPAPELLVLSTDGYGNSFADPDWRIDVAADLLDRARREGLDRIGEALPAWLAESASAGGDDVTMAILHRIATPTPAVEGSSAPVPTDDQAPTHEHRAVAVAPAPEPRRGPRIALVGLGVVAAFAIGAVAGWALNDRGGTSDESLAVADTTTEVATTEGTSTVEPTGTSTDGSAPATTATSQLASDAEMIVATPTSATGRRQRTVVSFYPSQPEAATYARLTTGATATTTLIAAGLQWQITANGLIVTEFDGTVVPHDEEIGLTPTSMLYTGGRVWVVPSDGTKLVACSPPTSFEPTVICNEPSPVNPAQGAN